MACKLYAEVAELADALRSGRSECTLMRVQIPPSAQKPRKPGFFVFQAQAGNGWSFGNGRECIELE